MYNVERTLMIHRSQIRIWYLNSAWSFRSNLRDKVLAIAIWGKKSSLPHGKQRNRTAYTGIYTTRFECDRNRASTSARGFLSCQEHVLPLARPAPSRAGTTFAPPRPPTALSPSRFRRIWIGPDNIAVGTTPRLHRHDIRGRISYIPLFPSFRIHL